MNNTQMTPVADDGVDSVSFEIHYSLKNYSHSLDAFAMNSSQREFLLLTKEIADAFGIDLTIEIFPLAEGGIKQYFRFSAREVRNNISTIAFSVLLSTFLVTPVAKVTDKIIDKIFENKELVELRKEKLRLQIKKLNLYDEFKKIELEKNKKALIHKSRFYKKLWENPKVEKLSVKTTNSKTQLIFPEREILSQNFKEYIVDSNDLPDIDDECADIEIISPVLKTGNYKWRGCYRDNIISFRMCSKEFQREIQAGNIHFKNGFTITCSLRIKRFLDENGDEKIKNYTVTKVYSYRISDLPIETNEGRKRRIKMEVLRNEEQMNLPFDDNPKTKSASTP